MVKLGELKKAYEEQVRREEEKEAIELTVYDAILSEYSISLLTEEKPAGIVCPLSVEKCMEVLKKIEEGKVARIKAVVRYMRIRDILDVKELNEDEIEVDGVFKIRPTAFGFTLYQDGQTIFVRPTVNVSKFEEFLRRGVDEVAAKIVGRYESNGRIRAMGIWVYPLKEQSKTDAGEPEEGSTVQ